MKKLLYVLMASCSIAFVACEQDDVPEVVPAEISNVRSDALPGQIVVRWDMPEDDETIHYIKVGYYDHRKQKNVINLSSCDSLLVDNTRLKYGDYEFSLTPYSHTETMGATLQHAGKSGAAPSTEIILDEEKFTITEEQLESNSIQSDTQAPIMLFDGDTGTIYHSKYGSSAPYPAYISIDLKEEISLFKINWGPRTNNSNGKPSDVDLFGSTDGVNWELIVNLTKEADELPNTTSDWYYSPILRSSKPFSYLKLSVNAAVTGSNVQEYPFWSMSELQIFKVNTEIIDPESPTYVD
ncbi:MAG: discoidin domain-containing protein [Mangrovibacterium sp.]